MMTVKRIRNFIPLTKQKRSDIMGVSPLVDSKGVIHINDNELPQLVSDQFASVFTHDDGLTPEVQGPRGSMIDDSTFTTNGIVKLLKDLNSEKASRFDKMSAQALKECANEVGGVLVLLFSASFAQGTIPEEYIHAIITQVYKGNNKKFIQS